MPSVIDQIKDIIHTELGLTPDRMIDDKQDLYDLGADSLDVVQVVIQIDKKFSTDLGGDLHNYQLARLTPRVLAIYIEDKLIETAPKPKLLVYNTAYPWCVDPELCNGKGYCPRDPNCGE